MTSPFSQGSHLSYENVGDLEVYSLFHKQDEMYLVLLRALGLQTLSLDTPKNYAQSSLAFESHSLKA